MSQTFDTSQWLAFFTKAGLPPNVSSNYALIFSDNRIQLDMLMDLSKEYLYDMGIRVMGDVIAILRFAKEFHTQMAKERAIGNSAIASNKVVGRMVGHYTRPLRNSPKLSAVNSAKQEFQKIQFAPKKSTVISLKRSSCNELPVKKVRKVSPEEEGAYKIKMPLGITDKTRKILQQQQIIQGSKRSVFARLGDSAVSSSTDSKSSSVFERLGPSSKNNSDDTPTSTSLGEMKRVKRMGLPLQYQGVLKFTTGRKQIIAPSSTSSTRTVLKPTSGGLKNKSKIVNLNRINSILQSNLSIKRKIINGSQGILSHTVIPPKVGIQGRLGTKFDSRNLARTKILLNVSKRLAEKKRSNVFDRLGK